MPYKSRTTPPRTFKLQTPLLKGTDVKSWQNDVKHGFKELGITAPVKEDGLYGGDTKAMSASLAHALGMNATKLFEHGITPEARIKIRNRDLTTLEKIRMKSRVGYRRVLRKKWATTVLPGKKRLDGIDVASYQPANIGSKVPCDFIFIKATEGTGYVSPLMKAQIADAKKAKRLIGLYHFASGGDVKAEAQHFISNIKPYVGDVIIVLDYEAKALARGASWADEFMTLVHAGTGVKPIIYGSRGNLCNANYKTVASKYKLWVASYPRVSSRSYAPASNPGNCSPWPNATIFQYSDNGHLPGYSGSLDLDVFYGDEKYWKSLTNKS